MIRITPDSRYKCCGCSACVQICAGKCITMIKDEEGFLYPKADEEKCAGCGLCEKVCPVIHKQDISAGVFSVPRAVGGWHRKEEIRRKSSSGGAFTLFAEYILKQGGIVYGCRLDGNFRAEHVGVSCMDDLEQLRGSKYIQSDINGIYQEIKMHLECGRLVLFTGTPCQSAGLAGFLGRKYENLYVCDFICHGVPSPEVFKSYIEFLEKKYHDKAVRFRFRNKDKGWHTAGVQMGPGTAIEFLHIGYKRFSPGFQDAFMNGFLDNLYLRPSCYSCGFKSLPKYYADVTIADFWGVKKTEPQLYDKKGTSLVLINNRHGERLFDNTKHNYFYKECEFAKAVRNNKSLIEPAAWNPSREQFFYDYRKKTFARIKRKYMPAFKWAVHKAGGLAWAVIEEVIRKAVGPILVFAGREWGRVQWEAFLQFVKFSIVGVSNVLVSYMANVLALLLLEGLDMSVDYIAANAAAFLLSVLWSWHWNSRLVFKLQQGEKRPVWKTLVRTYAAYSLTGVVMNNILATVWIYSLHVSKYISPLLNLPISMPVNFFINKRWTYKQKGYLR